MSSVELHMSDSGVVAITALAARIRAKVTRAVGADARRYVPIDTRALHNRIVDAPTAGQVRVSSPYWRWVEFDTDPHDIPNAFGSGTTVRHPGTTAQPYMRPALYQTRDIR